MLPFQTPTVVKVWRIVGFFSTLVPTTNAKSLTPLFKGGQRNYGAIEIGAARYSMWPFHTPSVVKVLRIVGLSLYPLLYLQQMQNRGHPYSRHAYFILSKSTHPLHPAHARCGDLSSCRFTDLRKASVPAFHPADTFMTCLTQSRPFCFLYYF